MIVDPVLQTVIAVALALLFAAAATHKWRSGPRFHAQLAEYRLLPEALVPVAAHGLAIVESLVAVALLVPGVRHGAGAVAAVLLAGYGIAIAVNLVRGRAWIDCGCGDAPQLLSPWLLARNAALTAGAVLVALPDAPRPWGLGDVALGAFGVLGLVLAYLVLEELLANASALREWSEARD
jgi:hypothetical protein